MIWSIIPEDTVFAGVGLYASPKHDEGGALLHMEVGGCPCQVRQQAGGAYFVEAVCSTNPKDFLRADLQPGQRITGCR